MDSSRMNLTGKVEKGEKIISGDYSDCWRGSLLNNDGKVEVAVKTFRARISIDPTSTTSGKGRLDKTFCREILRVWAKAQHTNVTPLLGYTLDSAGILSLISPWYSYGNVIEYLTLNPIANRLSLVSDITQGLEYLHSIPVVHGDIKPENVLVDSNGSASICDLGMAQFLDEALRVTGHTTSTPDTGGIDRYCCPELIEGKPKTTMSDIWAFGCVVMLTLTGHRPYQHLGTNATFFSAVKTGDLPYKKPGSSMKVSVWNCLMGCWNLNPKDRPRISELASKGLCEDRLLDEQEVMIKVLNKQLTHTECELQAHMDLVATLENALSQSMKDLKKARVRVTELTKERDSCQQQCTDLRKQLAEAHCEASSVSHSGMEEKMSSSEKPEDRKAKDRSEAAIDNLIEDLTRRKSIFCIL